MRTRNLFSALFLVLLIYTSNSFAITAKEFNSIVELIQNENYKIAFERIRQVKSADPNDPEYFVLAINYYFLKSQKNYINLKTGAPTRDSTIVLSDTLSGETVGYIDDTTIYNLDTLSLGISILKQGINLYPNRLDMRIGFITVTESSAMYGEMTDQILKILAMSGLNRNKWIWSFSKPYHDDGRSLILESVQCRMPNLMQIGTVHADSLSEKIAKALIKYYPESVYGHTNLGTLYLMQGDFERSLPHLLNAFKIDSKDGIVISNLGRVYLGKGDKVKAAECFKSLLKIGSSEEQEFARQMLKQIG